MERHPRRDRHLPRGLRQPDGSHRQVVDGDAFAEVEQDGRLEWLIRKDGCMHCADPGCLKACPAPGAILQYANGIVDFHEEHCIGCGYCITGCPFNIPRHLEGRQQGLQVLAVLRPRRRRPSAGLHQACRPVRSSSAPRNR